MSRWKRLSSERLIATTLVFFATSMGGLVGCEVIARPDRSNIGGAGGAGGEGGQGGACVPKDDSNACTVDACDTSGMQTHTPAPAGTACSDNDGVQCDDKGSCVECLAAADCPGTDDACQTRICTAGACGFDYTVVNTPVPTQTAGDCKLTVCDGAGVQIDKNDDTDLPDDSNACTGDVCTAGVPTNPNLTQGTDCTPQGGTETLVCDDMGKCVGCNTGTDCPGTDDECSTRTCTAGVCGVSFTAKDTPVAAQTNNNCLSHVCDGNGNFVDINDDLDLPLDDGNPCTSETCSMGTPNHPDLANGSACSDGDLCTPLDTCQMGVCTAGMAITCAAMDQCHVAGTCNPMTGTCSNPPANDGTTCNDGNLCTQTDACSAGNCTGTNPVVCTASDVCHVAGTCNTMTGMCSNPTAVDGTTCNDGNPCTQTDSCSAGNCTGANPITCMASDQCHVAGTCDSMTGMCSNPAAADGSVCASNMVPGACTMGTCVACGDGIKSGAEGCDDGNTTAGDGCNATCAVETGFACTGAPSVCTPVCGDGLIRGTEQCDDKNTTSGDGCSSTCQLDITCGAGEVPVILTNSTAVPLLDTSVPGAHGSVLSTINIAQAGVVRKVIPTINVAHGNTGHLDIFLASPYGAQRVLTNDVGSGANYTATTFSDAAATAITGAGLLPPYTGTFRPVETISNAAGFTNQTATGNWVLRVTDDTNGTVGTLNSWSLALCIDPAVTSVCGNGYVEANEHCDDGNAATGDGCANCQLEITCAGNETLVVQKSPNGALLIPDNNAAGAQSTINISNTGVVSKAIVVADVISHQYDGDLSITLTAPSMTALDLSSLNGLAGDNYISTIFSDAAATSVTAGSAPFRNRYKPEVALSGLIGQQTNGAWNLKVADSANIDAGLFGTWSVGLCIAPPPACGNGSVEVGEGCDDNNLTSNDGCSATCSVEQGFTCTGMPLSTCTFTCGNGTVSGNEQCDDGNTVNGDSCSALCQYQFTPETEPNNVCGTTNGPFTVPFIFDGAISPIADKDIVAFTVPAYADVKLETFAPTMDVCPTADTVIELRGTNCTTVLVNDDEDGINSCSKVDSTTDASARNLAPGTYFAYVEDYLNDGVIAGYKLQVTFTALCGDGKITGSETCDDANTNSGDGCANNCRVEPGFTCTGQPSVCM